jgi:hypothetical protein
MDAWLKSREKEKGTGRFDKKKISTGTVYTRKPETFNDPETDPEATGGAPKRRGRPMGKPKGPERVTAKSYKYKAGRPTKTAENLDSDGVMMTRPSNMSSEGVDHGEYDREGDMAKDDLRTIDSAAEELYSILQADDNLPEWVQSKITKAVDYIDTARDYMKAQNYEEDTQTDEAKYQGREVPLGKKMAGDVKKSKVYVRKPNGNIVKVNFGDKKMRIKKSNPARRKSFRARHNCANPGPRHKARYWSCRSW